MDYSVKERLMKSIGQKRYEHSIGVMDTAIALATFYKVDVEKAKIAGLLHDCAKFKDSQYLLKRVNDFDIMLDEITVQNKELIHGPLGAKIAEFVYEIKDKEILDAIRYHTTGKENMSLLEKIIYIADYIEPNRNFPGVDWFRQYAYKNLDKCLRLSMDQTIKYLVEKGKLIHIDTIKARNYLISIEKSEVNA